jgi:hypothetical protein
MMQFSGGLSALVLAIGVASGSIGSQHVPVVTATLMAVLGAKQANKD